MELSERERFKPVFNEKIDGAKSICILGHISPDGDCIGSALSVRRYIRNRAKALGMEKNVSVFLEEASAKFSYLEGFSEIGHDPEAAVPFELCIVLDCGDVGRLGRFQSFLKLSEEAVCVDHHFTNDGFTETSFIDAEASSTSEIVFDLFDEDYIDRKVAEAVYTGLVHDTGVFRYSCTSPHTMEVAGRCMAYGIDHGYIIDDSFFSMTPAQKFMLGDILSRMELYLGGKVVVGTVSREKLDRSGLGPKDMDGMIDMLRTTKGCVGAIFMYQCRDSGYKVSLRSNSDSLSVAAVASLHGGGGHIKAAGCFVGPDLEGNIKKLVGEIAEQLGEAYE